MGAGPELVCLTAPVFGVGYAFAAEMVGALGGLHVSGVRAGFGHHTLKALGVLQHRAGTEHVLVEGLAFLVGHEQRGAIGLEQGLFVDAAV